MSMICTLSEISVDVVQRLASGARDQIPSSISSIGLDKAWGGIHYLLTGSGDVSTTNESPEHFLLGGILLEDISEYVAVHSAERVANFSAVLNAHSVQEFMGRFDHVRMNEIKIYGEPWTTSNAYVFQYFAKLPAFVSAVANRKMECS